MAARRTISKLLEFASSEEGRPLSRLGEVNPLRHEVAERFIETEVMYQFSFRVISMQARGQLPNYEASTSKLFNSELVQRLARTGTKVFGLHAHVWEEASVRGSFTHAYVGTVPATIRGGTSEVQRNIIATRGLGLPRS